MLNYRDIDLYQVNSKEVSIKIAKRMHEERIKKGYTLESLAEKMRCTRQTAASWEKGWQQDKEALNRIPHMDQIMELCDIYKCNPGLFFARANSVILQTKMANPASPFWRKLQTARQRCLGTAGTVLQTCC